jgi:hypothetical protein
MKTQHKWLPSAPTDGMINEVNNVNFFASIYIPDDALADLYKVMWQAAPAVSQNPVAILGHDVPLYTHPPQPQPKQSEQPLVMLKREPLSEVGELMNIWEEMEVPISFAWFHEIARAIEKAHGIGETKCT